MNTILHLFGKFPLVAWPLTFACLFVLGFLIERLVNGASLAAVAFAWLRARSRQAWGRA